ncbi:hypothetical protein BK026_02615 [Alteromonas sp. V450]|uniref:helix-turn-helix transcriptional regulator n=1 Tax=Alteromonas sp. V450 TaxID=1912139 RepID=UPI0008FF44FC|nr:AraC family transcriptional regulator [Alteromonas sp. V450]OJF67762.1 hypothetical protein BK026_02615 [Alteromonas sp. V450]
MKAIAFLNRELTLIHADSGTRLCIHKAAKFLENNFDNNEIRVKDFAVCMHMSERSLRRKSMRLFKLSPFDLIEKYRIQSAKILLRKGIPVSDVSILVGYCSHSHFSSQFKKIEGISPITFKLSNALNHVTQDITSIQVDC